MSWAVFIEMGIDDCRTGLGRFILPAGRHRRKLAAESPRGDTHSAETLPRLSPVYAAVFAPLHGSLEKQALAFSEELHGVGYLSLGIFLGFN